MPTISRFVSGAVPKCPGPLKNIAVYEGNLSTFVYFPANPRGVKWTIIPTTDELAEVDIVNYNDKVKPDYTADYAFNSTGLIFKNATTRDERGHQISTAGFYTAECVGGNRFGFKLLVVRK